MSDLTAAFAQIRHDLRRLRTAPDFSAVFGNEANDFTMHPVLSLDEIAVFETRHAIQLPEEYRGFLLHVGNGGAGPAYGMFPLGTMDDLFALKAWEENEGFVGLLSQPFPHQVAWNDVKDRPIFNASKRHDKHYKDAFDAELELWEAQHYWNTKQVNGAIPLCHRGCSKRQWLVITGTEAGKIWNDDRADLLGLHPVLADDQTHCTFLQWYQQWLAELLAQVHG